MTEEKAEDDRGGGGGRWKKKLPEWIGEFPPVCGVAAKHGYGDTCRDRP
ncbi:MAG: hypothetical protein WC641_04915 [Patescibacteria group bacterium]